ncbi:MAG: hypothetical protein ACR2O6_12540 [Ilumatobacteraceae bacterium]
MDTSFDQLAHAAGTYMGEGDGIESGPFTATIEVQSVLDGLGVQIDYEAAAPDGAVLHVERSTLALDMIGGEPTLYVLCEELRGMGRLPMIGTNRYGNGAGHEGFELEIEIDVEGDELTYVWSWGPPHEAVVERSRAVVRRTTSAG